MRRGGAGCLAAGGSRVETFHIIAPV
jgi:hypothetical protein